ncbi:hypothetical protein [Vibrio sp. CK2-1]|uniref:glucosamine inositolphosphorylceramide transferase family protein n=1 Tax=Vibrio sp. CK2-1 TaxID=2912249 RepID=UPI001F2A5AC6|nr:hypothetical protein [Vibrio sp. CK2-1]MCF7353041.1 hypothetical protein [Vibrio sp. CK2-1]
MKSLLSKFTTQDFWRIGLIQHNPISIIEHGLKEFDIQWFNFTEKDFEADPFIFMLGEKHFIAYEIFDYSHGNGKIECVDLKGKRYPFFDDINTITGHKSYPFIFEEAGDIYCIVETSDLNEITLYQFNGSKFVKHKTLLSDGKYIDSNIKKINHVFYLFTSTADDPFKQLLFYSDTLLGGYQLHPASPIANDIKNGRNGGPIIEDNGQYYRVGQNCQHTYGGSLQVMKITTISNTEYQEQHFKDLMPVEPFSDGIHTLSYWGNTTVIDSKNILVKYSNIYRKIKYLFMVKLGIEKPFFDK